MKRSKINVRKTEPLVDIEQMAASIESMGLLENLVVRSAEQSGDAEKDTYEVVAGGRRLAALKLLAKRKKIVRDHPVPCLVLENGSAEASVEISLAENIVRAPVHPADQFDAFARLQKEGLPAEDIAARFGLSSTVVVQRLKLASVSPRLMAEYRSGEMTLEHVMAFTISDDHKAQEEAWFENPYGDSSPQAIRRWLTKSHVEGQDRRARFVGVKAYEEAGGIVVRDLFQPEDEGYFTDSQLLDQLASAKLHALAETIKTEGWGWVGIMLKMNFDYVTNFGRIATTEIVLGDEEEARLSTLCERYDELVAVLEEDGDDEASKELDRVSAELETLRAKKEVWPEEEKSHAGTLISLDYNGDVQIVRGLVKPGKQVNDEEAAVQSPAQPSRKEKTSNGYSDSLLAELSAHRTAALREVLASQPEQALTALLHAFAGRIFFDEPPESCIEITPTTVDLGKFSETVGESKAAAALLARDNSWRERLPEITGLWVWLERMEQSQRLELLAYCTGVTVNAVYARRMGKDRLAAADVLARAVSLDMADWWRPTQEGFLDRVTKDYIVQAVTEGVSVQAARYLPDLKKSQMSAKAEKLLADSRWLPEPLRTSTPDRESMNEAPVATAGE